MTEHALSGVEWCIYNDIFWLQQQSIIPVYPWDIMSFDEEKLRGYDQGFGGNWIILEQDFIFQWDVPCNTSSTKPGVQPTTLKLLMRGELPLGRGGKPMQSKEAQRRWFIDKIKIEKATGKMIGVVQEMLVFEAASRDDVINLFKSKEKDQATS